MVYLGDIQIIQCVLQKEKIRRILRTLWMSCTLSCRRMWTWIGVRSWWWLCRKWNSRCIKEMQTLDPWCCSNKTFHVSTYFTLSTRWVGEKMPGEDANYWRKMRTNIWNMYICETTWEKRKTRSTSVYSSCFLLSTKQMGQSRRRLEKW